MPCWFWTNREYVGIGTCLNLEMALWHNHNCILCWYSNTLQRRWHMTHGSVLIWCELKTYITVLCWLWTNRVHQYVGIGWCLNLNVSLLSVRCTMARSQLYTQLLFKHTTTWDTTLLTLILMLIEYMERCRVGFGHTAGTLLLVHVWIRVCHCFAYDTLWNHRNCILACHSKHATMAMILYIAHWLYALSFDVD